MFQKMKKYEDKKNLLLSFFLPIFLLLIFCIIYHITYQDFFVADLQEQYTNFFYYLKDVMSGKSSLFYSFSKQLGGSMLGTMIYYCSSPWNLFLFLIPKSGIPFFIVCLIFIKIGLCSMTMYIFMKNHFKEKNNMMLLFSLSYSLSGYVILYYFNIMWLDIVYLAPLVFMGIDQLLEKKKTKLYIITLFLSIISNCYIAYMLCIFSLIYFIYQMVLLQVSEKKEYFILFMKSSLITVLLSSFILIPFIFELMNVYRIQSQTFFSIQTIISNILDFFSSFFFKNVQDQMPYWKPNLYMGISIFLWMILYYFNKNISKREKNINFMLSFVFLLFYSIPFFNNLLHGTIPLVYNYRYTFLILIFFLLIGYQSYQKLYNFEIKTWIFIFIFSVGIYLFFITTYVNPSLVIINIFFIISYLLIFQILSKYHHKNYKRAFAFVLLIEIFISLKVSFVTNQTLQSPYKFFDENKHLCQKLESYSGRIEGNMFSVNENLICDHGKISEFNTMNDKKIYDFFKKSGIDVFGPMTTNNENNLLLNSILGIKYVYTNQNLQNDYEKMDDFSIDEYHLYQNKKALPIGFLFQEHSYVKKNDNPFEFQNSFIEYLTGKKVFESLEIHSKGKNTFDIFIPHNYPIYLNYKDQGYLNILINGEEANKNIYRNNNVDVKIGNIYIENKYEGQNITLKMISDEEIQKEQLYVYSLNLEAWNQVVNDLSKEVLYDVQIHKNKLYGNLEAHKDETLFLSIPYHKNFTLYIDGKKENYHKAFDTFIAVDLKKGKHTIELIYEPHEIGYGIVISLCTILIIFYKDRIKKQKKDKLIVKKV